MLFIASQDNIMDVRRVLIYRFGSLGDTVIALPCFHLIARAFPQAERHVLTNFPVNNKAAPLRSILGESGLVHGYMAYPAGLRGIQALLALRSQLVQWKPDILVYLAGPKGRRRILRDALFFKSCGIRTLIGVPYTTDLRQNRWFAGPQRYEHEAAHLVRCLQGLGEAQLDDPANWDLHLTLEEKKRAQGHLNAWAGGDRFFACSVGTKVEAKDWGAENWRRLIQQIARLYPAYGLVFLGVKEEFDRSEDMSREWGGPTLNLCGELTPRESAAVLGRSTLFIGHDSGPMHLAASVGVPCVAIFSARNKPGMYFPYGKKHKVIYHQVPCYGCELDSCTQFQKKCITSITVEEVLNAVCQIMGSGEASNQDGKWGS